MLYEPRFMDTMFSVNVNLYNQQRRYSAEFSQSTLGGALTVGYPLIAPELTATLTYTLEDNQISTGQTRSLLGSAIPTTYFQQLPLYNMFNDGITSSIRPSLIIDTRDNRLYPTSGIYLRGSTELSVAELGAQTEFWRNRYTGRFYYPLGAGFVLKLNTEFGLVTSPGKDGVPLFLRFMLGGIMDVRGFEYRSLSPRVPLKASLDDNSPPAYRGSKIGGNMMFYDNLELEFPLFAQLNLKGVFFTDAGNTWNLEQKYCSLDSGARAATSPCFGGLADLLNLRTSYGAGIRWFSPLGPLRFEYGRPFKPLPGEAPGKFEFTIGNFF
jgi:outer membrane protein insertion porin family